MKKTLILSLVALLGTLSAETEKEAECIEQCRDIYEQSFDSCAEVSPDNTDCESRDEQLGECQKGCKKKQQPDSKN